MASWNSDALSGELGSSGPGTTYTMGARAVGTLPRRLDYNVDMAWQTGHRADDDIKAWAGHYALGWMVGNSASKPRVTIEYNHASGDDDPADGHTSTFDQLYPTNHSKYGTADLLGWRNMHDVVVGFGMLPASSVKLDVAVHRFILGTVADGLYSAGGGVLALNRNASSRSIGSEIDVYATFTVAKELKIQSGLSGFFSGQFLKESTGGGTSGNPMRCG